MYSRLSSSDQFVSTAGGAEPGFTEFWWKSLQSVPMQICYFISFSYVSASGQASSWTSQKHKNDSSTNLILLAPEYAMVGLLRYLRTHVLNKGIENSERQALDSIAGDTQILRRTTGKLLALRIVIIHDNTFEGRYAGGCTRPTNTAALAILSDSSSPSVSASVSASVPTSVSRGAARSTGEASPLTGGNRNDVSVTEVSRETVSRGRRPVSCTDVSGLERSVASSTREIVDEKMPFGWVLVVLENKRAFALGDRTGTDLVLDDRPGSVQAGRLRLLNELVGAVFADPVEGVGAFVQNDGRVHAGASKELLGGGEGLEVAGIRLHDEPAFSFKVASPEDEVLAGGRVPDSVGGPSHTSVAGGDVTKSRARPGLEILGLPNDDALGPVLCLVDTGRVDVQIRSDDPESFAVLTSDQGGIPNTFCPNVALKHEVSSVDRSPRGGVVVVTDGQVDSLAIHTFTLEIDGEIVSVGRLTWGQSDVLRRCR
jgi:hypothetical protein